MNLDMQQISSIIEKKLQPFENIRFAHLYFPFNQSDYESGNQLDLALNIKGCFDDEECFQLLSKVIDQIKYALGSDVSPYVVISNRQKRDYQYLIHRTGRVVFCRDRDALDEFQESFHNASYYLETDQSFKARKEQIQNHVRHAS